MTTPPLSLSEIRSLAEKATEGPYVVERNIRSTGFMVYGPGHRHLADVMQKYADLTSDEARNNAELFAAARTFTLPLCEALRIAVEALNGLRRNHSKFCCPAWGDPTKCDCGAPEHNEHIDKIVSQINALVTVNL